MGIEPFKVGSSLVCVIAQRLIKRNCIHCKEEIELTSAEKRLLKVDYEHVYRGKGCDKCNHTEFVLKNYEVMSITKNEDSTFTALVNGNYSSTQGKATLENASYTIVLEKDVYKVIQPELSWVSE